MDSHGTSEHVVQERASAGGDRIAAGRGRFVHERAVSARDQGQSVPKKPLRLAIDGRGRDLAVDIVVVRRDFFPGFQHLDDMAVVSVDVCLGAFLDHSPGSVVHERRGPVRVRAGNKLVRVVKREYGLFPANGLFKDVPRSVVTVALDVRSVLGDDAEKPVAGIVLEFLEFSVDGARRGPPKAII